MVSCFRDLIQLLLQVKPNKYSCSHSEKLKTRLSSSETKNLATIKRRKHEIFFFLNTFFVFNVFTSFNLLCRSYVLQASHVQRPWPFAFWSCIFASEWIQFVRPTCVLNAYVSPLMRRMYISTQSKPRLRGTLPGYYKITFDLRQCL